jgi:ABC-type antimicrobial peptide transport system permease subunit
MIKNYLLVAFRGLLKNKTYVIINTLGLGISLACCITAYLLLAFNIEFDNFHDDKKVGNVFAVHTLSTEKDGKVSRDALAPITLGPAAADEIAGFGSYTRWIQDGGAVTFEDKAFNEGIAFVDSTFFDLFDFPLEAGNTKSFKEKNSIFLNEELAKKYFGDADPIGKLMVVNFVNETKVDVIVGGVVKKVPVNNSFNFNAIMRIENFIEYQKIKMDDWSDWRNPALFVTLPSPQNAAQISKQFSKYIPQRNLLRTDIVVDSYELVPFKAGYGSDEIRSSWAQLRIGQMPIIIFSSMAFMILLIACFNLTNTSIAMTAGRLKEVGIRKAVGAGKRQIATQFLLETTITIVLSLLAGLIMAQFIVPAFYTMWQLPYGMEDLDGLNLFISLVILLFSASLIAGIYPALFSSKFKPTTLLKGTVVFKGTNGLTRTLVAIQFALSVIVMIAGVIFIQNSKYQDKINFGYDKDQVVTVRLQGERDYEVIKGVLAENPKILSVGVSDGNIGSNTYQTPIRIGEEQYDVQTLGVGINYFETMGMNLVEGRFFNLDNASDQTEGLIVNRAFLEKTKLNDPLNKVIKLHNARYVILGVIENHVDNLFRSKEPEPFVFYAAGKNQYITLLIKSKKEDLADTQKYLEATWKSIFPGKPFESSFQEDLVLRGTRETNANMEKIFLFITILGGLLSASGIFALASLNIAKRTKEIGIRKTLGASVGNILRLLNKEFVIILGVAGILGGVGGYYATNALLSELFAYHIPVGIIPVVVCALVIFLIGILTTSSTIFKAARSNPVDTLRSE